MRYITNIAAAIIMILIALYTYQGAQIRKQEEQQYKQATAMQIESLQWEKSTLQQENAALRQEMERRTSGKYLMDATFAYISGGE